MTRVVRFLARPVDFLARPVDGAWLVLLRVLFGATMALSMARFIGYGWVQRFYIAPDFHFKYWGFSWVEPLPGSSMLLTFWVLLALSVCVSAGLCFRPAAALLTTGLLYVQLLDVATYLNHYYLAVLICFLLTLSPAGQAGSLDAWLRRVWTRRAGALQPSPGRWPSPPGEPSFLVPCFWLVLLRFQVGVVYVFAGLAKLNADWLIYAQPMRIWLSARTELPLLGPLFTLPGVPLAMSWAGFLFDLTIVGWLSWRRTRLGAYAILIVFHVLTSLIFPIGLFPLIMSVLALVFFAPDWPRAWLQVASRWGPALSFSRPEETADRQTASFGLSPALLCFFAVYCAIQLVLPLRYLAYGGNVAWHEQGMRFSWRVMLRAKGGLVEYLARDRSTGEEFHVAPRRYLTEFQQSELVSQPDLILQLAHHIEKEFARDGRQVAVFATARSNLNGRRATALIDAEVDLTRRRDGLLKADFILPAPQSPPPETRPVL